MPYSHQMRLEAKARPGITKEHIISALQPLVKYFGWNREDLHNGFDDVDSTSLNWNEESGSLGLTISTGGSATYNYVSVLTDVAKGLHDVLHPTCFVLLDIENMDLESAPQEIWIGSGRELEMAQREDALLQTELVLNNTVLDQRWRDDILERIRHAPLPSETQTERASARPSP